MAETDVKTSEDAEMSECEGEKVVTMMDVLQEQQDFEEDANAVLGASDDKNCTYSKGYVKRQAIYACLTCCQDAKTDATKRAGVCLACSLNCHENHDLVELYTKRNFRCDCGNPKFSQPCQFTPNKADLNYDNKYNQNFSGVYCICRRPYPDPENVEEEEMIQCIICEDWLHTNHLDATVPLNDQYAEMICKVCMEDNDFLYDYSELVVNVSDKEIIVTDPDLDVATILRNKAVKEAVAKNDSLTNGATAASTEAADDLPEITNSTENKENTSDDVGIAENKPEENGDASQIPNKDGSYPEQSDQNGDSKMDDREDTAQENKGENETEPCVESTAMVDSEIEKEENTNDTNTVSTTENKETTVNKEASENHDSTDKYENGTEVDSATNEASAEATNHTEDEIEKNGLTSDKESESPTKNKETISEAASPEKSKNSVDYNVTSSDKGDSPGKTKRKLSTEQSEDLSPKKMKLDSKPCIRPRGVKRVYKGATFWPANFRQKLCTCGECVAMYKDLAVLFLTDQDDTVSAYETLGKIFNEGAASSQYEKGLQALSSLDRVQQINALTEYNKMRDKLLDFLKSFKDRKEIVKEEDIKAFFAGMKPKREPDGVYFCR